MLQNEMLYFPTDAGNCFIKAKKKNGFLYFFMDPVIGTLLAKERTFHSKEFYEKCLKDWGQTEKDLPAKQFALAKKIVANFEAGKYKKTKSNDVLLIRSAI
jgi:hypothetical protein